MDGIPQCLLLGGAAPPLWLLLDDVAQTGLRPWGDPHGPDPALSNELALMVLSTERPGF